MAATVWKGNLSFGLVSIPVRLVRAARAERVSLRQLHRPPRAIPAARQGTMEEEMEAEATSRGRPSEGPPAAFEPAGLRAMTLPEVAPVRRSYERADVADAAAVPPAELVKGYEYAKDQYVVVEEQDLRQLALPTSTEMQIVEFVRFAEIDPVFLETSYYVVPDQAAEKPYALLREAMRGSGFAAIGELTMHRRDHVVIVRPGRTGLIAHTMFYPDEVRSIEEFRTDTSLVNQKELSLATSLVQAMAQPFEPAQFKNNFRARLQQLIEARIEGKQISHAAAAPERASAKVVDILEALKRSLEQARSAHRESPEARTERKPASAATASAKKRRSRA